MIKKVFMRGLVSGLVVKILSMVILFFSIPLFIKYFGTESYGSLVTVTAFTSFLSLLNLGVPNAISTIGMQLARESKVNKLFNFTFPTYLAYTAIVLVILFLLGMLFRHYIENNILKVPFSLPIYFLAILYVCSNSILAYMQAIYSALHKIDIANIYAGILTLLPILSLFIVINHNGDVVFYFQILACLNLGLGILSFLLYLCNKAAEQPDLSQSDLVRLSKRNIAVTAITATAITVVSLVINQFDTLVVSYYLSKDVVVQYSILNKVVTIESMSYGLVFSSILPLLSNWFAEKNYDLIQQAHEKMLVLMSIIGGAVIIGNMLFFELFVSAWVDHSVFAGYLPIILYSIFSYFSSLYSVNYITYSSFNIGRKLMIFAAIVEPTIKIILTLYLTSKYGLIGTLLSVVLLAVLVTFPMTSWFLTKLSGGQITMSFHFILKHFGLAILPFMLMASVLSEQGVFIRLILLTLYLLTSWLLISKKDRLFLTYLLKNKNA